MKPMLQWALLRHCSTHCMPESSLSLELSYKNCQSDMCQLLTQMACCCAIAVPADACAGSRHALPLAQMTDGPLIIVL
jgi:hypothetical protein